jgi:hypothetical protein
MAAELHGDTLHVRAGHGGEMLADRYRAGERDLADGLVRDEITGDFRRHPEHQIEHAGRQAGIGQRLHQGGAAGRRFLRPLENDRAAGRQRGSHLAGRLVDGKIPGREGGDRPDRLLRDDLLHRVAARRDEPPIGAPRLLGEPVENVGAADHLPLGLGLRLAVLAGQDGRDGGGTFAQEIAGLAQDLAPIVGGDLAPGLETVFGGGERAIKIGLLGPRHAADGLAGRRIDHRQGGAADAGAPGAVDDQESVGIRSHLECSSRGPLFPGAVQRGAVHCRPGIVPDTCAWNGPGSAAHH